MAGTQTLKVIRIGNSLGVRLPRLLLARYQIGATVSVETTGRGILLSPSARRGKRSAFGALKAYANPALAAAESGAWADAAASRHAHR
jgi:antitoxin component of MazEF toxin-antitoxin module